MSADMGVKIVSPNVKYTEKFIETNYEYSTTKVKTVNGCTIVSRKFIYYNLINSIRKCT